MRGLGAQQHKAHLQPSHARQCLRGLKQILSVSVSDLAALLLLLLLLLLLPLPLPRHSGAGC